MILSCVLAKELPLPPWGQDATQERSRVQCVFFLRQPLVSSDTLSTRAFFFGAGPLHAGGFKRETKKKRALSYLRSAAHMHARAAQSLRIFIGWLVGFAYSWLKR